MTNRRIIQELRAIRIANENATHETRRRHRRTFRWMRISAFLAAISCVPAGGVSNAVTFTSYIGGSALAYLSVIGLKQHVQNPANAPMKSDLVKLGFGGMSMALPAVVDAIQVGQ